MQLIDGYLAADAVGLSVRECVGRRLGTKGHEQEPRGKQGDHCDCDEETWAAHPPRAKGDAEAK